MVHINREQIREEYDRLNQLLQQAVHLLEEAIGSEIGRRAMELGEFARIYAFEHEEKVIVTGRVGYIHYIYYQGRAMVSSVLPETKPIAVAVYNGRFIEEHFGWEKKDWEISIAEAWLAETDYMRLKYRIQQET